jgi:hypothetical protein
MKPLKMWIFIREELRNFLKKHRLLLHKLDEIIIFFNNKYILIILSWFDLRIGISFVR